MTIDRQLRRALPGPCCWRSCAGLILLCAAAWGAPAPAPAEPAPPAGASASAASPSNALATFRKDDDDIGRRLVYGLVFVGVVALAGWAAIKLAGKGLPWPSALRTSARSPLRVVGVVRVTPKLLVASIRVAPDLVIVVADNGSSIVKLAELAGADSAGGAVPPC